MLPVSIFTGFLGSGKTTVLNRLLQHPELKNSLVIINEFGEVGIDHLLVSTPAENVRLLSNGCLCCEVRGDLVETLTDVSLKRASGAIPAFDRILIETTGLADPVPIVQTIVTDDDLSPLYSLDRVICLVDAVHALNQLASQDEVRKQIAIADVLLLSKTDLVSLEAVAEVVDTAKSINPGADVIPVVDGQIEPSVLFAQDRADAQARDVDRWLSVSQIKEAKRGSGNVYKLHAGDIRTFTLFYDAPVSITGLVTWLSMLASFKGPQLLRVKGIVNVGGDPYIIHAVQTVIHEPVALEQWPSADQRTRIVFIVRGLEPAAIEKTLAAFGISDASADTRRIDPDSYARFLEAAKHFM